MQSVRKLNKHDSDILSHGYEHLAKALCLLFNLVCIKRELSKLCNTVYQQSYIITKLLSDLVKSHVCVFYHIVQQGTYNSVLVHTYLSNDNGRIKRMYDIRLSGLTFLVLMLFTCYLISSLYGLKLRSRSV